MYKKNKSDCIEIPKTVQIYCVLIYVLGEWWMIFHTVWIHAHLPARINSTCTTAWINWKLLDFEHQNEKWVAKILFIHFNLSFHCSRIMNKHINGMASFEFRIKIIMRKWILLSFGVMYGHTMTKQNSKSLYMEFGNANA